MPKFLLFITFFCVSCSSFTSGFSGENGTGETQPASADAESEAQTTAPVPEEVGDDTSEPPCTDDQPPLTQADLLTDQVINGAENQSIVYELFVTDCQGTPIGIQGSVAFDAFARLSPFGAAIGYLVQEGESKLEIDQGQLEIAVGKDLFGNTGDEYGYYQTNDLELSTSVRTVILVLDVSGLSFRPVESQENLEAYDIPTYLSIGDSMPIEKTVKFVINPESS
ncbi:hypothetical protein [Pseudobacteriovorax antillogorgiicola]|uniref:Uncharacterized protein n=1 Tax=Pseudobacteriovorax antillogorgiicola TaxID=1513793 RepID=A0A1Y6B798_9BACT|nr:hypothetical protein [Pseudobacteriovorax antillogorgiicola]TCS58630.1 hypothetical protein EDD56_102143 [Pseudobacteriovorax antillogorgiicola]SME96616.1 hypothetical protein SAMN06296036_102300 [Pseudobacteriovorax antillogorgiicola]